MDRQSDNYYNLWRTFDLTGVSTSTSTRLGIAVGSDSRDEIHNLMAFYLQVSLITTVGLALLLGIFGAITAQWLQGNAAIGVFAALLALTGPADAFYGLVIFSLQSRRSFRESVLLQNLNQFVLTASMIAAVLISPTPEGLVLARLFYSYSTLVIALMYYERTRTRTHIEFPSMSAVLARVPRLSPRPYWRFGVANALDKNVANLYTQLPIFLVGLFGGAQAVGFLTLSLTAILQAGLLTSALFENLQAVVPQLVGRKDYKRLWRNFSRVTGVLALGAVAFYGAVALIAPLVIPALFGAEWQSAVPVLIPLTIFGAVTTVGGVFAPLYRAFGMLRSTFTAKLVVLVLVLPVGIVLMKNAVINPSAFFGWSHFEDAATRVAVAGAWTINVLLVVSVTTTMMLTLSRLRKVARETV